MYISFCAVDDSGVLTIELLVSIILFYTLNIFGFISYLIFLLGVNVIVIRDIF